MKILHICAGWQKWNGAAIIARMIMDEQRREGHEVSFATWANVRDLRAADEVWIHCGWLPCLWWAALWAKKARWMPEACYDPVRLKFSAWKKRLTGPFERWALRRCEKIVATCEAEKEWIKAYLGKRCPEIEETDVKRFFKLAVSGQRLAVGGFGFQVSGSGLGGNGNNKEQGARNQKLNLLYLGRRHPLKGVEYLEEAVRQFNSDISSVSSVYSVVNLKIVSNAFGEEKERVWDWCDVLVLPTLSENFGLVVAEALERGKRVITTDGAPVWGEESGGVCECVSGGVVSRFDGRLLYLKGYRDGTNDERVRLLKEAILVASGII